MVDTMYQDITWNCCKSRKEFVVLYYWGACSYKKRRDSRGIFEYVEGIAQPSYFRKQYNSWYDHMTDITEEGILKKFF